jgi:hypothetical protein
MADGAIMSTMALCKAHGKFLFEARPDIFPEGRLTDVELAMWGDYYEGLNREAKKRG